MLAKPSKAQLEWHRMERSMFVHFGPAAFLGKEYDDCSYPLDQFNPAQLDTEQWCQAALSWGAGMIILVAKHFGGFCWWQTDTTEYSVKNTPWRNGKGDLLAELSASCQKHGLKLGVYIYPGDEIHSVGNGGKAKDPAYQETYNQIYRQQLTEVLTRYGEVAEVWFDGSCAIPMEDILQKHAPDALVFQSPCCSVRWCGTEQGCLPLNAWSTLKESDRRSGVATVVQSDPNGDAWAPLEVDTTLYDHFWFWSPSNTAKRKSLEHLIRIYYQSVGRGGVLLLNSAPTTTGLIDEADMARYREFGAELSRRFGSPLGTASGEGEELLLELPPETPVNHVRVKEEIQEGERVRAYRLEARTGQGWTLLARGEHLGAQKLFVFEDIRTDCIRLTVEKSVETPLIRELSAFRVEAADLPELIAAQQENVLSYDPVSGGWISLEQGQAAGSWKKEAFCQGELELTLDISGAVPQPGQYAISFVNEEGEAELLSLTAILDGDEAGEMLSSTQKGFCLTRTGAVVPGKSSSVLKAVLKGTSSGTVYVKRLV